MRNYDPKNWYWMDESGKIFSSAKVAVVEPTDEQYVAWLAAGNYPTRWPADDSGVQCVAALQAVLDQYGLHADLKLYARSAFNKAVTAGVRVNVGTDAAPAMVHASTDALSLSFLTTAVAVAKVNPSAQTPWVPETGNPIMLTAAHVLKIDAAVQAFVQELFGTLSDTLTAIATGAIVERAQVDAAFAA